MLTEKESVCAYLDKQGICYERIDHPAIFTIDGLNTLELSSERLGQIPKNLFLKDRKKNYYLVVLKGDKRLDLKGLGKILEVKELSFASEEVLWERLGLKKGAVTPLGLLNDKEDAVRLIIDKEMMALPVWGVHPNDNTATIFLAPKDILTVTGHEGVPLEIPSKE